MLPSRSYELTYANRKVNTSVATSDFRERLAYALWVRQLWAEPESDAAFAERAGIGYDWLQKWKRRPDAPNERTLSRKLAAALEVSEAWLLDELEAPPRQYLWLDWLEAYRGEAPKGAGGMSPAERVIARTERAKERARPGRKAR